MTALYRKYRSKRLSDVVGQQHITDILQRAINTGRISHAYLLTGPRGVGKTSVARILAHEINQLPYDDDSTHLDIIEIDAASNNGVEDVRDLREKVRLAPVSAPKKVYIIDEVHMLSKSAFNALLKTLEEPPEHVVFILATTDVDKLPATIISRTQQFGFRAIPTATAVAHLKSIATTEKITVSDQALQLIAERADGSFRDSISMLDQLSSLADEKDGITPQLVESILGLAPQALISSLLDAVSSRDAQAIITLIRSATDQGIAATTVTDQLLSAIEQHIAEGRQWLDLFDQLLEVCRSSQPELKLISVLCAQAVGPTPTKPTTVALSSPVRQVSASVEELKKKKRPTVKKDDKPTDNLLASNQSVAASSNDKSFREIDWSALIDHTRTDFVALYSVLSKCDYELSDEGLTIYARNAFYKKKLDDPKYNAMLVEAVRTVTSYEPTIHILATAPPPKDSQAAQVVAIMGGGEEVSVETSP